MTRKSVTRRKAKPSPAAATPIRPTKAPVELPMPSRAVLAERVFAAMNDAHRATRLLRMLRVLADSDTLDTENAEVIDGIGETLDLVAEIVGGIADQLDSVTLLASEARS